MHITKFASKACYNCLKFCLYSKILISTELLYNMHNEMHCRQLLKKDIEAIFFK